MPSPSREDRICAMLDSFAKTVCRNFVRNLRRDEPVRDSHLADEQAADILEKIGHGDTYPSDFFVLYVDGHACVVESETLYKALLSLPEREQKVLLLDFWRDWTDREISRYMEVSTRTVYNLRQRAYRAIRQYYEQERLYPWTEL